AELLHGDVERLQGGVVALVGVPQLGSDEQVLTRYTGRGDRAADAALVAVHGCRVHEPVADPEGLLGGDLRLVVRDLPDAETELGDLVAVAHRDAGNGGISHGCHRSNTT